MTPDHITNVLLSGIGLALLVFGCCMCACEAKRFGDVQTITGLLSSLGTKFEVLARVCAASQAKFAERNAILVVDDSSFDSELIGTLCRSITERHDLVMTFATSLDSTYSLLSNARVVILDVLMAETTIEELNALIDVISGSCPVIVNSVNEYSRETFPNAFAVCNKWTESGRLTQEIEKALTQ